jgi:N-acetylneuraminic acid mutarotase
MKSEISSVLFPLWSDCLLKPRRGNTVSLALALATLALNLSVVHEAQAASWVANSPLITARYDHTATLLTNGQVLVAGGNGSSGYLSSAELYNPASGTWTNTGSLITARQQHTATLLPNGKVLVVGGFNGGSALTNAELYDPASGTWTNTGALTHGRYYHTATLLTNGQVLVAGGVISSVVISSAELYVAISGTWTNTGLMTTARYAHTATVLTNGQVLVAGGDGPGGATNSAELYDPVSRKWTVASPLGTPRDRYTATLLTNGQVLAAGGFDDLTAGDYISAELYNPAVMSWTPTGSMNNQRSYQTATLLTNGQVLVAGGSYAFGNPSELSSAELYDPAGMSWKNTAFLNTARYDHTATLLPNGKVLVAGGFGPNGVLSSTELYDSTINVPFQITSIMRTNAHDLLITWNTTGISNIVQVTTGVGPSGSFSTNGFSDVTNLFVTSATTNFLDVGAVTNHPARYYRIRSP